MLSDAEKGVLEITYTINVSCLWIDIGKIYKEKDRCIYIFIFCVVWEFESYVQGALHLVIEEITSRCYK